MDRIIRGPWINSALEEIANDPDARNRDIARYSQPPPPYTSPCRSAATTEFEVPDFEEPQAPLTRSELRLKLQHERCASCHVDAHVPPSQEMQTPLENGIARTIEPRNSSAAAPSHARMIGIENEEHDAVENQVEHDSSRIRDKSSPSLPSNSAAAVSPQRSNVDQNAATGFASNTIAVLPDQELATVEEDPGSSPPRRSQRLQDKAKKPVMPSSGQTVKPLRQTRRKPAG